MKDKNKISDNRVILKHGGWIIKRYPSGYEFYHEKDTSKHHVVYPSTLASALELLFERVLLDKRFNSNSPRDIQRLYKLIVETKQGFRALCGPDVAEMVRKKLPCQRNEGVSCEHQRGKKK